eukprot:6564865-Prymnesium_polylepis.2
MVIDGLRGMSRSAALAPARVCGCVAVRVLCALDDKDVQRRRLQLARQLPKGRERACHAKRLQKTA